MRICGLRKSARGLIGGSSKTKTKMMFSKERFLKIFFCLISVAVLRPASAAPDTQWFRDAKFGIFVHWGLYSELGNEWKSQSYYGSGEWIMNRGKIPANEYAQVANRFNPTNFNAEEWTR